MYYFKICIPPQLCLPDWMTTNKVALLLRGRRSEPGKAEGDETAGPPLTQFSSVEG